MADLLGAVFRFSFVIWGMPKVSVPNEVWLIPLADLCVFIQYFPKNCGSRSGGSDDESDALALFIGPHDLFSISTSFL